MSRRSIIKNTAKVGKLTLLSRVFGLVRELLSAKYLGADVMADAFKVAFAIPNSFRKIFAEGALSAAFVPAIVRTLGSGGKKDANGLMSLAFIFFEGLVLILCAFCMFRSDLAIDWIAPGFSNLQYENAVALLKILMPFIFFLSSSALLAGALQSINSFFVPAISPFILNVVFIIGLIACLFGKLPVSVLCYAILFGGLIQLVLHIIAYLRAGFSFGSFNKRIICDFGRLLISFFVCCLSRCRFIMSASISESLSSISAFCFKLFKNISSSNGFFTSSLTLTCCTSENS